MFEADRKLFPALSEQLKWDNILTDKLAIAKRQLPENSVLPTFDEDLFQTELDAFTFKAPTGYQDLIDWVVSQLEHGVVHVNHPRYLGLFNSAATFPSQCADRIAAAFNPQLASGRTSPAAVAIEDHVIRSLAQRAGMGQNATGNFTSGGSEGNFTALVCALTKANPDFAARGCRAFPGAPTFYVSRDSHLAWIKIAHQSGIGRDAVRMIPTDGHGKMDATLLASTIATDIESGDIPVMIVATAGTTNAGMVDPLHDCADIAKRFNLWFHVDAAWGGGAIASETRSALLSGIERSDSITIDAHKWFATTMGCGIVLVADPEILKTAFKVAAYFMPLQHSTLDPYTTTLQWSRRFMGLRLFMSLAAAGWSGHGAHVDKCCDLKNLFVDEIKKRGWTVHNNSGLAVACFSPPESSMPVRDIIERVHASGAAWLSSTVYESRDVIRLCVTNGETTPADIMAVIEALEKAR